MRAEILSVGTELLLGQIVDTNAAFLAQQLSTLGVDVYWISQVGDNRGRLVETFRRAWSRSDLIVVTGGLGPTEDDLTREAIAEVLGEEMVEVPELVDQVRAFFARRGREMPPRNAKQGTLIPSARALPNPIGTAPGWWVERDGRIIVAMPGVPVEMRKMWEEQVLPRLRQVQGTQIILSRTLKVLGLGESAAEEMVRSLLASTNPTLATYAKQDGVHLRITAKADSPEEARALIASFERRVLDMVGDYVYGADDDTPAGVVGRLLTEQGLTVATAESCSGGWLANALTDVPGSSKYFVGGFVTYTAETKRLLGVPQHVLDTYGTVHPETSAALARAARERTGADIGVGITGVAGPDAVEGQVVGTVHVVVDARGTRHTESSVYSTTRTEVKRRAALDALFLLWRALRDVGR